MLQTLDFCRRSMNNCRHLLQDFLVYYRFKHLGSHRSQNTTSFLCLGTTLVIFLTTRGRGHYMAKKEDFSYEIFPYLSSVSHYVSLFSVCYQATNVSPSFLCVTVNQMLVSVFCVLLVTHGRFTL